eukprot:SAG31_NODE_791_length_12069_cov_22.664411_10_plen_82_part_00
MSLFNRVGGALGVVAGGAVAVVGGATAGATGLAALAGSAVHKGVVLGGDIMVRSAASFCRKDSSLCKPVARLLCRKPASME